MYRQYDPQKAQLEHKAQVCVKFHKCKYNSFRTAVRKRKRDARPPTCLPARRTDIIFSHKLQYPRTIFASGKNCRHLSPPIRLIKPHHNIVVLENVYTSFYNLCHKKGWKIVWRSVFGNRADIFCCSVEIKRLNKKTIHETCRSLCHSLSNVIAWNVLPTTCGDF